MGKIFNLDNPVFQGISKLVDCVFLSLLWLIFSIPVITLGASTSALYYTATKVIRHDRGYIFKQFWHCFKTSFKQSTGAWLLYAIMMIVLYADTKLIGGFIPEGMLLTVVKSVFYLFMFIFVLVAQYVFPYIARFELSLKHILINCAIIALRHLPWTILLVIIWVACLLLGYIIPIGALLMPAAWGLLASLIIVRIFKKYMSDEDREKEEKLNSREYM